MIASCLRLDWGLNLQPRQVLRQGIEPTTIRLQDNSPTNLATLAMARILYLLTYEHGMSFYLFRSS